MNRRPFDNQEYHLTTNNELEGYLPNTMLSGNSSRMNPLRENMPEYKAL